MELSPVTTRFILHWGEMGSRWGVNRTVAQIHALLYLADRPLHAEEISETLVLARSNVSTAVKELQSWGLVRLTHVLGDRRDHFEALQDIWAIFSVVAQERKKRELDPTMTVLRDFLLADEANVPSAAAQVKKIRAVLEFLETLDQWNEEMKKLDPASLGKLMRMGAKVQRLLG